MADIAASGSPSSRRAWIEIGRMPQPWAGRTSPSSRRAWIEIRMSRIMPGALQVALLAEGVDRNAIISATTINSYKSPSSRRAWIEILPLLRLPPAAAVALLAEGVDRNSSHKAVDVDGYVALLAEGVDRNIARSFLPSYLRGRPPRGGRG